MTSNTSATPRSAEPGALPDRVVLDGSVRLVGGGRTVIGGSPLRIIRMSDDGASVLRSLVEGAPVPASPAVRRLVRRLLDAGVVHPSADAVMTGSQVRTPELHEVVGVVPVHDDAAGAVRAARSLLAEGVASVIVVDDGSSDPAALDAAVHGMESVRVVRHVMQSGPGGARDSGWRSTDAPFVVFCDADVVGEAGWLGTALRHLADPSVAVVGPRVRAAAGERFLDRYEALRSPLDLGSKPARVAPRTLVAYLPAAALVVRRSALEQVAGFDPLLRYGEDVDLIWRVHAAGWTVRYDPAAEVRHRNRRSWGALARQRTTYGSAAAPLAERHGDAVAPLEVNIWSAIAWGLALLGGRRGRRAGLLAGIGSSVALIPKLRGRVPNPAREAMRLAGLGHLWSGRAAAVSLWRAWLPIGALVALLWRPARPGVLAATFVPPLAGWVQHRREIDPLRWCAAYLLDDAAYCAGVWRGCLRRRRWAALAPVVHRSSPELRGVSRSMVGAPAPAADAAARAAALSDRTAG